MLLAGHAVDRAAEPGRVLLAIAHDAMTDWLGAGETTCGRPPMLTLRSVVGHPPE
jgi:hypothetical protein